MDSLSGRGAKERGGFSHATLTLFALAFAGASYLCHSRFFARTDHNQRESGAARTPGLRTALLPAAQLDVGSRLLGLWRRGLLLGSRRVGSGPLCRRPVAALLLGLVRRQIQVPSGLLGPPRWLLRRRELRLWVRGHRFHGRRMARQRFCLQHRGDARE